MRRKEEIKKAKDFYFDLVWYRRSRELEDKGSDTMKDKTKRMELEDKYGEVALEVNTGEQCPSIHHRKEGKLAMLRWVLGEKENSDT